MATILFENGQTQLARLDDGRLLVMVGGVDWKWPTSVAEGIEMMLKRDWDHTLDALVDLVLDASN